MYFQKKMSIIQVLYRKGFLLFYEHKRLAVFCKERFDWLLRKPDVDLTFILNNTAAEKHLKI